ncbi:MAG: hypothetical protein QW331_02530 [Candidatus Woesearchaeota archaeon]
MKKGDVSYDVVMIILGLILILVVTSFIYGTPEKFLEGLKDLWKGVKERFQFGQEPIAVSEFQLSHQGAQRFNEFSNKYAEQIKFAKQQLCFSPQVPKYIPEIGETLYLSFTNTPENQNADALIRLKKGDAFISPPDSPNEHIFKIANSAIPCLTNTYNFIECIKGNQEACRNRIGKHPEIFISDNVYTENIEGSDHYLLLVAPWDQFNPYNAQNELNGVPLCFIRIDPKVSKRIEGTSASNLKLILYEDRLFGDVEASIPVCT